MVYRIAVLVYTGVVALGALALLFAMLTGNGPRHLDPLQLVVNVAGTVISSALWVIPIVLLQQRWRWWRRDHSPLLPADYCRERLPGHRAGMFFAWVGHGLVGTSLLLVAGMLLKQVAFAPAGLGLAAGLQCYLVAMYCVEISVRGWRGRHAAQPPPLSG